MRRNVGTKSTRIPRDSVSFVLLLNPWNINRIPEMNSMDKDKNEHNITQYYTILQILHILGP